MDYNSLVRKAKSKNIRITKKTASGRRYLTATELRRKLKRKKRSKKVVVKRVGFWGRLFGRPSKKSRKVKKLKLKSKKVCKCRGKRCKCRVNRKLVVKGRSNPVRDGAFFAIKTLATGAAIQLGTEAAKQALQMYT